MTLLKEKKKELSKICAKLDALSPLNVISRGYALVESKGKVVTAKKQLSVDDELTLTLSDGIVNARVTKINEE